MPVQFKDYYASLGLTRDASDEQVKKAYRALARKYHPDVAKDKKASEEKFKEINEANEVLSDPVKRKKYDELGAQWKAGVGFEPPPGREGRSSRGRNGSQRPDFHFEGTGFSDFFEQFFSGAQRSDPVGGVPDSGASASYGRTRSRRGGDIEGDILVTLHEVMKGSVRSVSLERPDPNTGEMKANTFQVRIPPGVLEGQVIRVAGKGEEGHQGGTEGDLLLRVRLEADPDFKVQGADLHREINLAPWEAVLGANVVVPTLDGEVTLRIPAGTQSGQRLRARGQGLPKGKSGDRGDLHVTIGFRIPSRITDEQRALWEKLRSVSAFDPRKAG